MYLIYRWNFCFDLRKHVHEVVFEQRQHSMVPFQSETNNREIFIKTLIHHHHPSVNNKK